MKPVVQTSQGPAVVLDMTPERKERFSRVSSMIVDLVKAELESPMEAHAVLQNVLQCLEVTFDIRASFMLKDQTEMKQ